MEIKIYDSKIEVKNLDEIISFRTGCPKYPTKDEQQLINSGALISWGFTGTVTDALEMYPDIVKII